MITCEMFSVFGFFKASSMKYLSPLGVCFTLATSIEQSVENGVYSLFQLSLWFHLVGMDSGMEPSES